MSETTDTKATEKKTRGRKKASKEACKSAFRQVKNRLGMADLQLQVGKDSGRCTVVRVTVDEDGLPVLGDMVLEGMAGNSFIDGCKMALAFGWEATCHPRGFEVIPHDEESEASEAPETITPTEE